MRKTAIAIAALLFAATAQAEEAWTPPAEIGAAPATQAAPAAPVASNGEAAEPAAGAQLTDAEKAKIIQAQEAPRLKAIKERAQAQQGRIDPNMVLPPLTAGDLKTLMDAERLNAQAASANAAAAPIIQKINKSLGIK